MGTCDDLKELCSLRTAKPNALPPAAEEELSPTQKNGFGRERRDPDSSIIKILKGLG